MQTNSIIQGDCLETLKTFPDNSINCVITSPPYWQLRDYGWTGQWGLEKTYQEYLDHLIELMKECKRVLKPTGTMFINLGDSYGTVSGAMRDGKFGKKNTNNQVIEQTEMIHKCLMLTPHRFAIRCIDELGLILRNDIIWAKRNGMPESVTDRFSKKHEFFFFFVKQQKYYFDLDGIKKPSVTFETDKRCSAMERARMFGYETKIQYNGKSKKTSQFLQSRPMCNPGDVSDFWDIPTQPSSEKHYATFNTKLIDKPIIAGCPEGGIILDPFCGTGTTLARAVELGRKYIGIEGNPEYVKIAQGRTGEAESQLRLL